MYAALTVKWSNTLFGCLAVLLSPVPIVLFFWGPKIRSRSKYAKLIENWQERQTDVQKQPLGEDSSSRSDVFIDVDSKDLQNSRVGTREKEGV
jgi:hypothetical protein